MSFRDEMKASLKTPQQVMNEKENAELQKIKESANAEFERMKVELKRQASEGHYVDLGTRQIVHAEITSDIQKYCDIVTRKGMQRRGLFGNDTYSYVDVICTYSDQKYIDAYFKELDALVKPEEISYSVIAKYRDTVSNNVHTCMVPGNMRIHSFGIMASEVKICIRVSMQL